MTKEIRSPNDEKLPVGCRFRQSDFIILSDFVIRHSGLGLAVMGSLDDSKSCIATMNHWRPAPHAKAPINRTHSKRFALPAESADHAFSVWRACVFSAAFPRQCAIRCPGGFRESPLSFFARIGTLNRSRKLRRDQL